LLVSRARSGGGWCLVGCCGSCEPTHSIFKYLRQPALFNRPYGLRHPTRHHGCLYSGLRPPVGLVRLNYLNLDRGAPAYHLPLNAKAALLWGVAGASPAAKRDLPDSNLLILPILCGGCRSSSAHDLASVQLWTGRALYTTSPTLFLTLASLWSVCAVSCPISNLIVEPMACLLL
jgi:hypothetical protein